MKVSYVLILSTLKYIRYVPSQIYTKFGRSLHLN